MENACNADSVLVGDACNPWPWKWDPTLTNFVPKNKGRFTDLTGQKFGKLTALYPVGYSKIKQTTWKFVCDCGNEIEVIGSKAVNGYKLSCGCSRKGPGHFGWTGYKGIPGKFLSTIIRSARVRGHVYNVSLEYLWELFLTQDGRCAFTGIPITFKNAYENTPQTASLDRIDSSKGYEEGNLQWVHKNINKMKNTLADVHFISLCSAVHRWCTLETE